MQGQLREEPVSAAIETECAHCGRPLRFGVDDQLDCRFEDPGIEPLLFVPRIDFGRLKDPSIVDAF